MGEVLGLALNGSRGNERGGRMDYGGVPVSYRSCPMRRKGRRGKKRREGGREGNSIGGRSLWNEERGGLAVRVPVLVVMIWHGDEYRHG